MALYTRKEFAALCRTTTAVVTTNINRDKIVLFDKKIDSENRINKTFFDKYYQKAVDEDKAKKEIPLLYEKVVKKVKTKSNKKHQKEEPTEEQLQAQKEGAISNDWDLRKKRAEALLKERNAEKALLSVKKMYGEMVPTDFVVLMFSSFTKTILSVFDNSLMNLAGVYCDELAGGDRTALAKVNQRLNEELQSIITEASDIAKKDMKNEIKQYSIKRGKGESK